MQTFKKLGLAAGIAGAMFAGGVFGYTVLSPVAGGAQTTNSTATTSTTTAGTGQFHSNEDPAHEKGESAQREADENAGRVHFGGRDGQFHPNEDPAHEKSESPQREAEENAGRAPTAP